MLICIVIKFIFKCLLGMLSNNGTEMQKPCGTLTTAKGGLLDAIIIFRTEKVSTQAHKGIVDF